MSCEIDSLDCSEDDLLNYANWMQSTGLWNGRPVSLQEAPEFQKDVEKRMAQILATFTEDSYEFQKNGS